MPLANLKEGSLYGIWCGRTALRHCATLTHEELLGPETPRQSFKICTIPKRFPRKRCLFKYPQFSAVPESALLADGVPRDKLYPLDVDKALAKLDTIKSRLYGGVTATNAIRLCRVASARSA